MVRLPSGRPTHPAGTCSHSSEDTSPSGQYPSPRVCRPRANFLNIVEIMV